jgi:hypothetical protein
MAGLVALLFSSCAKGPRPTEKPETSLVGSPPKEAVTPDAPAPNATPDAGMAEAPMEAFNLQPDETYVTETGFEVRVEKVPATDEEPATVFVSVDGEAGWVALPAGVQYAEGRVEDSAWSLSRRGGVHMEWRHGVPPLLDVAGATALANAELDNQLGCDGRSDQVDSPPGTVTVTRTQADGVTCTVTVGMHTRTVIELR